MHSGSGDAPDEPETPLTRLDFRRLTRLVQPLFQALPGRVGLSPGHTARAVCIAAGRNGPRSRPVGGSLRLGSVAGRGHPRRLVGWMGFQGRGPPLKSSANI
ncbi:MAG: hypothetical protein QW796_05915 [Thermoproteota archaeon]